MATIPNVSGLQAILVDNAPSVVTLGASDTFTYLPGKGQTLRMINTTAGALTPTITGSAAAAKSYLGDGGTVNYAAGYSPGAIAATTGDKTIYLDQIAAYLQGVITITGASGLKVLLSSPIT